MHQDLATIYHYVQAHWGVLVALVGGAGGLSTVLEVVLHKLHVDSKKVAFTLLHVSTVATTAVAFFLTNLKGYDTLPMYGSLVILAETWHRFVVSPVYSKFIVPYLQYLETTKASTTPEPTSPPAPVPEAFL